MPATTRAFRYSGHQYRHAEITRSNHTIEFVRLLGPNFRFQYARWDKVPNENVIRFVDTNGVIHNAELPDVAAVDEMIGAIRKLPVTDSAKCVAISFLAVVSLYSIVINMNEPYRGISGALLGYATLTYIVKTYRGY